MNIIRFPYIIENRIYFSSFFDRYDFTILDTPNDIYTPMEFDYIRPAGYTMLEKMDYGEGIARGSIFNSIFNDDDHLITLRNDHITFYISKYFYENPLTYS